MSKSYVSQTTASFGHSNLYFGTAQEADDYNTALIEQGLFEEDDLQVGTSNHPVNAKLSDGRVSLLAGADEDAQDEAAGENAIAQSRSAA